MNPLILPLLLLQAGGQRTPAARTPTRPDIVLFVIDDVARTDVEDVSASGWTPNLDALAARGVYFTRAYAHARCAPTRDSLLYGHTLGLDRGDACAPPRARTAGIGWTSLPAVLAGQGYSTLHVGKWHTGTAPVGTWKLAPELVGFEWVRFGVPTGETCNVPGPSQQRLDDGIYSTFVGDNTLECRDVLLEWWAATPAPRFAVVNFGSAHAPFVFPDSAAMPPGYPTCGPCSNREKYEAEIAGVDHVVGQTLAALGGDPFVFFLGDNGTPGSQPNSTPEETDATRPDQDPTKVKLTCYEDGVRVPLIVAGPGIVAGHVSDSLVHVSDLLPTLAYLVGIAPRVWGLDGVEGQHFGDCLRGLPGPRKDVFVWNPPPRLDRAVIERRWKLLTREDGVEELYDLELDPRELAPLPPTGPDAARLRARRKEILGG